MILDFAGGEGGLSGGGSGLPGSLRGVKVNLIANAIPVIVIPSSVISEAIVTPSFLNNSEIRTLSECYHLWLPKDFLLFVSIEFLLVLRMTIANVYI